MEIAYSEALKGLEGQVCPRRAVTPPNRLETGNRDLLLALLTSPVGNRLERLRERLRDITGRKHVFFAPSCRAAIAQVLALLPHREVVMPAFTCPVLRAAVELAGKQIVYVDCAKGDLNATSAEFVAVARPGRVLAPTHLFGLPTDVEAICALARDHDCITIEDAAAAFGSRHNGRLLGTIADFGVFSFERSKRVPAFRGAAIVVNNEALVDPAALDRRRVVGTTTRLPARELLFSLLYNVATVPSLYGRFAVQRILRAHRATPNPDEPESAAAAAETAFYNRDLHPYQADLVLRTLERWDAIREHVGRLVATYRRVFAGTPVRTFVGSGCDEQALLRFPIALPGRARGEILRRALRRGLYLETNYERPLPPASERHRYPNAFWAAENLLLLPLYRSLAVDAAEDIARQVVQICDEIPSGSTG